jgi:hypothetical protein
VVSFVVSIEGRRALEPRPQEPVDLACDVVADRCDNVGVALAMAGFDHPMMLMVVGWLTPRSIRTGAAV